MFFNLQFEHSGFMALQWYLPKSTNWWWVLFHLSFGIFFINFFSILVTSSFLRASPNLLLTLVTWVSTAIQGSLYISERKTLAVFRPTPGSFSMNSLDLGMISLFWWMIVAIALTNIAFLWYVPISLIIFSISSIVACDKEYISLYWLNRTLVTLFTLLSVVWALNTTAINSS